MITDSVSRTARRLQVIPLALLTVFFAAPVASMVIRFVRLDALADTVTDPSLRGVWWFTFWQACASTLATLLVAVPLTWAVSRHSIVGARLVIALVTVPFFMPAVIIATGMKAIIPNQPLLGILWAHVVFNVAVVVRVVGPRWSLMDVSMEDTAADLGAHPMRIFTRITLPFIAGALRNAASIVFVFCFTSYGVISILGGISRRTVESEVFTQAVRLGDMRTAISLSMIQAIVVFLVFLLGTRTVSTERSDTKKKNTNNNNSNQRLNNSDVEFSRRSVTRRNRRYLISATLVPTLIVATPLIAIVIRSFVVNGSPSLEGYRWLFDGTTEQLGITTTRVITISLIFATTCALLTTACATVIAFARNATRRIAVVTALPLVVSAVTLGLGIIVTFDSAPFAWRANTWLIPVIHAVIALPLAVRTIDGAVGAIPDSMRMVAASLGAGPWRSWRRVELPLVRPAIARAAGLSAAISIGEFGATSFLSRSNSTTIPIAISQLMGHPGTILPQTAFALASLCVVVFTLVFATTV
jgi:thiamine transport system permease protein